MHIKTLFINLFLVSQPVNDQAMQAAHPKLSMPSSGIYKLNKKRIVFNKIVSGYECIKKLCEISGS